MIKFGSWAGNVWDGACLIGLSYVWDLYITDVLMKMAFQPGLLLNDVVVASWLRVSAGVRRSSSSYRTGQGWGCPGLSIIK